MGERRFLTILFVAAVAVRLLFCFFLFPRFLAAGSTVGTIYFFDSYREIAVSLLTTGAYELSPGGTPAIHRPPGYVPLLLAAMPRSHVTVALFQTFHALLGGLACVVTFALARAVGCRWRAAGLAAAIVALWPFLVWETKVTVPENLLVLLVPLAALTLLRACNREGWRWAVMAGAVAGYTAITHALYQLLLPAGALALLLAMRTPWKKRVTVAIVFLVIAAAPVAAWSWRNGVVAGYPRVAAGMGLHYWKTIYYDDLLRRDGVNYFRDHEVASTASVSARLQANGFGGIETNEARSDPARNRFLDRAAMEHAVARPGYTAVRTLVKAPLAWVQQQTPRRAAMNAILVLPLLLAAIAGAIAGRATLAPLSLPLLLLNLGAGFIFVEAIPMRYALPWVPLAAVLAVFALERVPRGRAVSEGAGASAPSPERSAESSPPARTGAAL